MKPRELVSVDCGVGGCGVALFIDGVLRRATYVKNAHRFGQGSKNAYSMAKAVYDWLGVYPPGALCCFEECIRPDVLAIETMKVYPAESQKGDQNDLLGVQLVAGAIIGIVRATDNVSYVPREWKGTIDADVCTARVIERLTSLERAAVLSVGELDHNTYDGIGIGLKYLGRFEPRRIFARD